MQDEKLTDGQKDLQVVEGKVSDEISGFSMRFSYPCKRRIWTKRILLVPFGDIRQASSLVEPRFVS